MIDDDARREALLRDLQPDIARNFLREYLFDASLGDLERGVAAAIARRDPSDFVRAVIAIESVLDREQPDGLLVAMVAGDANRSLDDPTEPGARAFLEDLAAALRGWLGDHAPPPRARR